MSKLMVGDKAPTFTATLQDGSTFDMADMVGRRALVLFFYPKDDTPVCTREACSFRDSYELFAAAGADVIGVSSDSPASHQAFAERHRLPFPIISDQDRSLRKLYGVPNALGFVPGRVTFVIDRQGVIRMIYSALFASDAHVRKALEAVAEAAR